MITAAGTFTVDSWAPDPSDATGLAAALAIEITDGVHHHRLDHTFD